MSFPAALAGVGIGASALGGITSAFGSWYSGQAQSNLYNYQANVARINSNLAQQDANYSISSGETSAQEAGLRGRFETGAIRGGIGAGNIDIGSGSAANVTKSQTEITQENEGIIRADAAKRAYGFNVKASMDTAQAGVYQTAAATSSTAGDIGAVSSIIGGAGSVSSKWLQAGQYFGGGNSSPYGEGSNAGPYNG